MALLAVVILKLAYNDLLLLNTQLQDIYLLYCCLFRKIKRALNRNASRND